MQRRSFLQMSLAVPALAYTLPGLGATTPLPKKSVLVRAGQDRSSKPFEFLDAVFTVKVSGQDNEGRCVIFDTLRRAKVGPALHLHTDLDEWFYVLDGEFKFQAGTETLRLQTGDSLLIPREMVHAFVKISEGPARLIVMHQPAGSMEEYFRLVSQLPDQSLENRKALAEKHGMRFVGPQLQPD